MIKPLLQYSLNGEFIREWTSKEELEDEMLMLVSTIQACCKGMTEYAYGYIWRYKEGDKILPQIPPAYVTTNAYVPIIQYTLEGDLVKEWGGLREIRRAGIKISGITSCCTGLINMAGGYMWKFREDFDEVPQKIPHYENKVYASILQYNRDGTFLAEWIGIKRASILLNIPVDAIRKCLAGDIKVVENYIFKYKISDEIEEKIDSCYDEFVYKLTKIEENVLQYDLDGNFVKRWNSKYEAEINTNINLEKINGEKPIKKNNYFWIYRNKRHIPVRIKNKRTIILQYDKNGKLIRKWGSQNDVNAALGTNFNYQIKTNKNGSIWLKQKNYKKIQKDFKNAKVQTRLTPNVAIPVLQYTYKGEFIREWKSLEEAAFETKTDMSAISKCCKKKANLANGCIWRFKRKSKKNN